MFTWMVRQDNNKTYVNTAVYFNGEMEKLNAYAAASGNTTGNHNSINAVSEINALVLKQANEHAFAIREFQNSATEER